MNKIEELKRRCINYEASVNKETPRYYIVHRIKYDFESGGWCSTKDLSKTNELKKYGTYDAAEKYALNLYYKYNKELGEDMEVCIREELVDFDENKKLKKRIAKLGNQLALTEKALEFAHIELQQYSNEDYYSSNNPTWYGEDFNWKNYLLMKAEDEIKKDKRNESNND